MQWAARRLKTTAAPARRLVLALASAGLTGCAVPPHSSVSKSVEPLVALSARLELEPLDLSPDGEMRLLVRMRYTAADGRPAHLPAGGHVVVAASRGEVQWQPRARFGDPAAIVRLSEAGPLAIEVTSDIARVPHRTTAVTDSRAWRLPSATARALGPHAVQIGWFPRVRAGSVSITRHSQKGTRTFAALAAPISSFCDTSVQPGGQYTYELRRPHADRIELGVGVPAELRAATSDILRGKAMWLSFDDSIARWNVDRMLERASQAGIVAVELRLAYGEYFEITPARRPIVDRFIDGAAERGIAVVAWTVPRAPSFEDIALSVAALAYRTARGHTIAALAVDLERGSDFMGGPSSSLATYIERLRQAVGPRVLLVATVEDPFLERLGAADVPYAAIAKHADVLQPMTYWRVRAAGASNAGVRLTFGQSARMLRRLAERNIPIDIGGQTANLVTRVGAPPPGEIAASIAAAHDVGAIGETFFDWDGTTAQQWSAIAATPYGR